MSGTETNRKPQELRKLQVIERENADYVLGILASNLFRGKHLQKKWEIPIFCVDFLPILVTLVQVFSCI